MTKRKKTPCNNCPWRKSTDPDSIPNYSRDLHQRLVRNCQRDGLSAMQCHKSTDNNPQACVGFVVQVGFESIGLRMLALFDGFDIDDFDAGEGELYDTLEDTINRP